MSAKRVTGSTIDWIAFAARVPKNQVQQFNAFKAKSDAYLRNVASFPESLPKIHWDQYASRVAIPGMVEDFKKQYESLKIPYPTDQYTAKINEVEKESNKEVAEFVSASEKTIAEYKVDLIRYEAMMPVSEMTMQEFYENFPELSHNHDNPTMHPHTPDAQPGYVHEVEEEDH